MNKDESIMFATKYLEDLLSFFGINMAITATCEDDVIELNVPSSPLNSLLIGKSANNLRSLQHIVSASLIAKNAEIYRVNIDVADFKRHHAEQISERGEEWIRHVRETGKSLELNLNPADRRIIHKLAEDYSDITTHSVGEGHDRKLIIEKISE